jgi:hypothetical protein
VIARGRAAAHGAVAAARAVPGGGYGCRLATQAIGLVHRVEHGDAGGWIAGAGAEHRHLADGADAASEHHCAAFDALTLGDSPPAAGPATAVVAPVEVRAAPTPAPARAPTHVAGARARAPPSSIS